MYTPRITWSDTGDNWDLSVFRGQAAQIIASRSVGNTSIASATLVFSVKHYFSDTVALLTKTGAGQIIIADPNFQVNILVGDTVLPTMPIGTYYFDVRRTDLGNEGTLVFGRFQIKRAVGVN